MTKWLYYVNIYNMKFKWKKTLDFPGYEVSNYGDVRNIKTKRVLKCYKSLGYRKIKLPNREGLKKSTSIHRLVYESFHGDIEPDFVIDHINRDRSDNSLNNLRAVSQQRNMNNKSNSRLRLSDVQLIVELYKDGMESEDIHIFLTEKAPE